MKLAPNSSLFMVTMFPVYRLALLGMCSLQLSAFAAQMESKWPEDLDNGPPNALEVFETVEYSVAVRDVNSDAMFKCLTAWRTDLDLDVPSATYVWSLYAGEGQTRKNATLYYTLGPSVSTALLVVDSDNAHPDIVRYLYTDDDCGILEVRYFGYQCTLWMPEIVNDTIPEHCLRRHEELCGEGVSLYDETLCRKNHE